MRFIDYIRTAFKNLSRQKARTFLTILAVVVGAVSVMIMLALVVGAKQVAWNQLEKLGELTMVRVTPSQDIDNYNSTGDAVGTKLDDTLVNQAKKIDHVVAVSPSISAWSFEVMELKGGNGKKVRPNLNAYEPQSAFDPQLSAGKQLASTDIAKIVIDGETLRTFGYDKNPQDIIGKTVVFSAKGGYSGYGVTPQKPPQNADNDWWKEQEKKTVTVEAEIIGAQEQGLGGNGNYITMAWARQIMTDRRWEFDKEKQQEADQKRQQEMEALKQQGRYAEMDKLQQQQKNNNDYQVLKEYDQIADRGYGTILLKVDSTENVESVAEAAKKLNVGAYTAKEMLEQITKIFNYIGIVLGAIGLIALFVASIGIINTMVMAIYERTREIGVMRACGATRSTVRKLFTFEAGLLGFIGGIVGILISYGVAFVANTIINRVTASQSIDIEAALSFPIWLIGGVLAFTTVVGLLAGIYPAFKAAKLDPVEALRYE